MTLLEALGEPADCVITIDFETFYTKGYELKKLGIERYVRDDRFQVIGIGVKVGAKPAVWMNEADFRVWATTVKWDTVAVLAHNTAFDGFILSERFGIVPGFLLDTLSMGRAIHGTEVGGSLDKLSTHYHIGVKGTDVRDAKGKRLEDFTHEEWFQYGRYCANDCELTYKLFWALLADGFTEHELWVLDSTIRMFVSPTFVLDEPVLIEFREYERQRKADLLARVNAEGSALRSDDSFAALLIELGEEPEKKLSVKKTAAARKKDPNAEPIYSWAFAKSDPYMKGLLEHETDEVRWLAEARIGAKSTQNETRTERLLGMGANGRRVPVFLKYHGAHTGRWAGGDGSNMQNLERCDKRNLRKGVLRKALLAPEGQAIVAVDSSQIEARFLAWEAGDTELVQAFADGRDVYSEFATVAYGHHVDRKRKLPDGTQPDETKGNVGKTCVLGLGYGMGWAKLATSLLAGPMGSPPVQFTSKDATTMHVDVQRFAADGYLMKRLIKIPTRLTTAEMVVHCAVSKHLVDTYRKVRHKIVAFWQEMDVVLMAMFRGEEYRFGPNGCLRTTKNRILLPWGRTLKYPELDCDEDGFSFRGGKGGKLRVRLYGGILVENITQALARDAIAEQMLWIRVDGYPAVTTTHDEIVAAAAEENGERAYEAMLRRMKIPPEWAAGVPLSAEGGFARSYGSAK